MSIRARAQRRRRCSPRDDSRDEGSSLILALVVVLIGTMLVLPVMDYTMAVTRSNRVSSAKADRVEAVKGGLRAALYDPVALYQACRNSGRTFSVGLTVPPGLNIVSSCTTTEDALQDIPSDQRYALATTQVGSGAVIPPPYVAGPERPELDGTMSPTWCTSMVIADVHAKVPCGKPYPDNGAADPVAWTLNTSTATSGGKIYNPSLPPFSNTLASVAGYDMPAGGEGPCKVYFPGKYIDDLVITGATPVYFASGVYYFEKTVRISGDANVVVGTGATPGCVESDAVAVADAIGAPFDAYSNGVGGTFVFGANGRLVVDTATASATAINLKFNRRLVAQTDPLAVLNDISIMSVNGVWNGTSTTEVNLAGQLYVPVTPVFNGSASVPDPWTQSYKASNLVSSVAVPAPCAPPPTVPAASCPIIDLNFTNTATVNVKIPGYVAIPQGTLSLSVASGAGANKSISFGGGILTAQMGVAGEAPNFLQLGLLNPIVQKTFKITTRTSSGKPEVISTALVQVNETGGYAVNSWVVQSS